MRCLFEVIYVDDSKVIIQDLDGPMSVTNDAEAVVDEFFKKEYPGRRMVYRDTYGEYTEIVEVERKTWLGTSKISFIPYLPFG